MVLDSNQPPLPSPRGAVVDDDVIVIDSPPTTLPPRKRRGGGVFAGGGSSSRQFREEMDKDSEIVSVVCSKCLGVSKFKFSGTEEDRRVWKCYKCLLRYGDNERPGRSVGASESLDLLDMTSSPSSEEEADGAYAGPVLDGGDGTHSGKSPVPVFSSSPGHNEGLSSNFIRMPFPEKRSNLQKAPHLSIGIGKSGSDGIIEHQEPVTVNLNEIRKDSAAVGAVQDKHSPSIESLLQTPKNVYLQGLKDYISERKGILSDGWRVEFEFSSNRVRTFAVYINADGRRFESMPEVAQHLGLPSTSHPSQSEHTPNGLLSLQNDVPVNPRRKEISGVKAGSSRKRLNIPKGSSSIGVQSSGIDSISIVEPLTDATRPLTEQNATEITARENSQAVGEMASGEVPEWAKLLEPIRKLATNNGGRIRKLVKDALLMNPPEWAKVKLGHSISKEVYKGNASGPTKRIVVSVLNELNPETSPRNPKRRK